MFDGATRGRSSDDGAAADAPFATQSAPAGHRRTRSRQDEAAQELTRWTLDAADADGFLRRRRHPVARRGAATGQPPEPLINLPPAAANELPASEPRSKAPRAFQGHEARRDDDRRSALRADADLDSDDPRRPGRASSDATESASAASGGARPARRRQPRAGTAGDLLRRPVRSRHRRRYRAQDRRGAGARRADASSAPRKPPRATIWMSRRSSGTA